MVSAPYAVAVLASQPVERSSQTDVVPDELPVVVAEAQETSDVGDIERDRPLLHRFDLLRVGCNTVRADDVAQVGDFRLKQLAFGRLQLEVSVPYAFQHTSQIPTTLAHIFANDDNVIKIRKNTVVLNSPEHCVHQPLKSRRCSREPEWHVFVLPVTRAHMRRYKSRLLLGPACHGNLVITGNKVQRAEHLPSSKGVQQRVDTRQRVRIRNDGAFVQITVIDAHPPLAVLLLGHTYIRRPLAFAGLDDPATVERLDNVHHRLVFLR